MVTEGKRLQMIQLLEQLLPEECAIPCDIKGVTLVRMDEGFHRTPKSYEASIIFLAQGAKTVYLGNETFTYDSSNYLVLSVPMPIECEAIVKPGKPLLGFFISLDPTILGEMLLEMDVTEPQTDSLPKGIYGASVTEEILDAEIRLLQTLFSTNESRILGTMVMRELIFRAMVGENGTALQALVLRNRRFFQIARVLGKIHESFNQSMNLDSLAKDAGMSISTFHSNFKAITSVSPLQYIKNVRLHKARELITTKGFTVNSAAYQVGYESPSQFNREYKRYFGITPAKDELAPNS